MKQFITDVATAPTTARKEASRELGITLVVSLGTFFIGPLLFSMLILPAASGAAGMFQAFTSADIYIAAVSLLSISIYSISKEYKSEGRDRFGFPHAATIMSTSFMILLVAFTVYTGRIIYEALPPGVLQWRDGVAAWVGWTVFATASAVAYGVLVLRNDVETGGLGRSRMETESFVTEFSLGGGVKHD